MGFVVWQGEKSMTGTKYYLLAKLHGMRRYCAISVYRARSSRPDYRLQRLKARTSFFDEHEQAEQVMGKLQKTYPSIPFKVKADRNNSPYGYGVN